MQADGHGRRKGKPDGVSAAPNGGSVHGRNASGENGGGAYPNAKSGRKPEWSSAMTPGGQTDIGYHGGQQAGDNGGTTANATTRGHDNFEKRTDP